MMMIVLLVHLCWQEIYKTGGKKLAFLNVPPLGCFPGARISSTNGECLKEVSIYAILHNQALPRLLKQLQSQLPGFKYSLYDFYTNLLQRIDHPSKYGMHFNFLRVNFLIFYGYYRHVKSNR